MCAAGALRGSPASTTATRRRARVSTRAAERPAAPPPTTTTSYSSVSMSREWSPRTRATTVVAIPGKPALNGPVEDTTKIAAALELVGPRLKQVRAQRGVTLADLSERTGISKSTLSRLENGQRRPSLELLLPLAQAYRVPLDDLVGAPEVGDPRIRLRPRRVHGRTVLALTGKPGGVQAWKIVIPADQSEPKPRVHDGYEWLYVLSGRMRLVLADQDFVLGEGEVVEFDTRLPHWFGSTGEGPGRGAEHLREAGGAHARPRRHREHLNVTRAGGGSPDRDRAEGGRVDGVERGPGDGRRPVR